MNIQARPKSSYIRVYQEINYESHKWWQFVARKYINMPYETKVLKLTNNDNLIIKHKVNY